MKILQLCNKPPQPATDGGCLAMDSIAQGLLDAGHNVRVLSIATHKASRSEKRTVPQLICRPLLSKRSSWIRVCASFRRL